NHSLPRSARGWFFRESTRSRQTAVGGERLLSTRWRRDSLSIQRLTATLPLPLTLTRNSRLRGSGSGRFLDYCPRYKIRPHCSQLTISFPALTRAAVAVVTFMWQPVQTPCSTATIAASPLLLNRRSNWSSKSASILDAS